MITEYDQRQLDLMRKKLEYFEQSKISLNDLICDLEALLYCLQNIDKEWCKKFHEECFDLEQIYAVALDRNEPLSKYDEMIKNTITNVKILLDQLQ